MSKNRYDRNSLGKAHSHSHGSYRKKVPPFTPDPEHWTRKGPHGWKAKEAYESEDDACEYLELNPKLKAAGYRAYLCKTCNKWHIGHLKY